MPNESLMIKYFQLNSCLEDASDSIFRKTFSVVSITDGYVFIKETWSLNPLKNYALGIWIRYKLLRFYGSHKKLYINRKVRSVIRHSIVLLSVKIISHNERECFPKTFWGFICSFLNYLAFGCRSIPVGCIVDGKLLV